MVVVVRRWFGRWLLPAWLGCGLAGLGWARGWLSGLGSFRSPRSLLLVPRSLPGRFYLGHLVVRCCGLANLLVNDGSLEAL